MFRLPQFEQRNRRGAYSTIGTPPEEVRRLAREAGYAPDEIMAEMADWARATGARSADWIATSRNWIRRERRFQRQPGWRLDATVLGHFLVTRQAPASLFHNPA